MAESVNAVTTGKPRVGGGIYWAPIGTQLPSDATTTLAAAFKSLGYISQDGYSNTNSPSSETIREWGGSVVLTPQTEKTDTFSFTLLQHEDVEVLKVAHGDSNVTGTIASGITVTATDTELEDHIWVIDEILRDNVLSRTVIPCAKVTEIGEIVHNGSNAISYPVTLTAMKTNGFTHKVYLKQQTTTGNT